MGRRRKCARGARSKGGLAWQFLKKAEYKLRSTVQVASSSANACSFQSSNTPKPDVLRASLAPEGSVSLPSVLRAGLAPDGPFGIGDLNAKDQQLDNDEFISTQLQTDGVLRAGLAPPLDSSARVAKNLPLRPPGIHLSASECSLAAAANSVRNAAYQVAEFAYFQAHMWNQAASHCGIPARDVGVPQSEGTASADISDKIDDLLNKKVDSLQEQFSVKLKNALEVFGNAAEDRIKQVEDLVQLVATSSKHGSIGEVTGKDEGGKVQSRSCSDKFFLVGSKVIAHSLKNTVLNGSTGIVKGMRDDRVVVYFSELLGDKLIKPLNLKPA